jgi:hypothetical protein
LIPAGQGWHQRDSRGVHRVISHETMRKMVEAHQTTPANAPFAPTEDDPFTPKSVSRADPAVVAPAAAAEGTAAPPAAAPATAPAHHVAAVQSLLGRFRAFAKSGPGMEGAVPQADVEKTLGDLNTLDAPQLLEVARGVNAHATLTPKTPKAKILKQISEMVNRVHKTTVGVWDMRQKPNWEKPAEAGDDDDDREAPEEDYGPDDDEEVPTKQAPALPPTLPPATPHATPAAAVADLKGLLSKFRGGNVPERAVSGSLAKLSGMPASHLWEVAKAVNAHAGLTEKTPKAKTLKQITEMVRRVWKTSDNVRH